jgi:TRAP-type C4-dicarboxylate transport system substrate-binding protein
MQRIVRAGRALGSALALVPLAVSLAGFAPLRLEAATVIKLGTIAPEGSVWYDAVLSLSQRWRKISGGEVELRVYPGGVLGGEDEMVRKMQRQGLDALAVSGSGLPLIDSVIDCLNIPLLFDSYDQLDDVRRAIAPRIESSFEAKGYKILNWAEAGWVHFFAKSPVRTPDDLRRQRLWISTGGSYHERLLKQLGFRVVALPATDMLTGLQTGLIEATDVPPLFALLDRSYEVANYMTVMKFAPLNAATVIRLQSWQRIPARFRDEFLQAAREVAEQLRRRLHSSEQQAIDEMVKRGLHLVEIDARTRAQWSTLVKSQYSALACGRDHPDLLEQVLKLQRRTSKEH